MKKKILFMTNHIQYSDGVVKSLTELVNALDKDKYDITIMPVFRCDEDYLKNFDPAVRIKKMFGFYFRGFSKIVSLLPQKMLYKHFIKEQYDLEIAFQFGEPTKILANSTNKKAKHIAWIHGYGIGHLKDHESFDKIVCCSKSSVEKYKRVFKYPERIAYLYNLVNEETILKKATEEINVEKKYDFTFCTVGRLSPEKGFLRLLKCHKRLMDKGLKHNLWIVGGGAEYDTLDNYVTENSLGESVKLFGKDNNPYKYMSRCDAFVCSSYSEGFSTVCVEAAMLGKPVVTTEVGGAKEFVEENGIGIMTKNTDEALYLGMKEFLTCPDKLKEYSNNILNIVDLKYKDRKEAVEQLFCDLWKQ